MTTPSDPNVRIVQQTSPDPVSAEVVETATKIVRAKSFMKKTFKNVGVPVLAGAIGGLVVRHGRNSQDSDTETDDYVTDPTE